MTVKKPTKKEVTSEEKKPDMNIPEDIRKQLEQIKDKLDKFSSKVTEKFKEYVTGIALVPPRIAV